MPTKINEDFKPDERSYLNLRKHGVLPDFIDDQLPTFIAYWMDTEKKKASWQMTLQVWMRRAHQGRAGREWEENRHIRHKHHKPKEDVFSAVLDDLFEKPIEQIEEIQRNLKYKLPEPPAPGPAMSSGEAFEQLRGILK